MIQIADLQHFYGGARLGNGGATGCKDIRLRAANHEPGMILSLLLELESPSTDESCVCKRPLLNSVNLRITNGA